MASRVGQRPMGTDGRDFYHRERVAGHYKASVVNKSRLKYVLYLQLAMWLLVCVRLSTAIYVLFGMRPPSFLQRLKLPVARLWEYGYLFSILPTFMAFFAMPKNRAFVMKQFLLGSVIFGMLPVLYGVYDLLEDLLDYLHTREAKQLFRGFPLVLIWAFFLAVAFQVHTFGFYFGKQLVNAWQTKGDKKRN